MRLEEIEDLHELRQSLDSYASIFSNIGISPSKEAARELANSLKLFDKVLKSVGRKTKDKDLLAANSIWSIAFWYLGSDIRPMLSVFIRRVETHAGELEFERMRFRLADHLSELINKLNSLEL